MSYKQLPKKDYDSRKIGTNVRLVRLSSPEAKKIVFSDKIYTLATLHGLEINGDYDGVQYWPPDKFRSEQVPVEGSSVEEKMQSFIDFVNLHPNNPAVLSLDQGTSPYGRTVLKNIRLKVWD